MEEQINPVQNQISYPPQLPQQQNSSQIPVDNIQEKQGGNRKWQKISLSVYVSIIFLLIIYSFSSNTPIIEGFNPFSLFPLLFVGVAPLLFIYSKEKQSRLGKILLLVTFFVTVFISHILPIIYTIYVSLSYANYSEAARSGGGEDSGWLVIGSAISAIFLGGTFFPVTVWLYLNSRPEIKHRTENFVLIEVGYFISYVVIIAGLIIIPMLLYTNNFPEFIKSFNRKPMTQEERKAYAESQFNKALQESRSKESSASVELQIPVDFKPAKITYVPNELKFVGTGKQFLDNKDIAQYYDYYDCSVGGTTKFLYVFQYISPRSPITRESFSIPTDVETSDTSVLNNYALFENNKFLSTYVLKAYRNSTLVVVTASYECIGDLDPLTEMKKIVESMQ